ncbi:hypothetical protein J3Q64DRAFT_1764356 [Phycomyces blakesleeanus]
MWPLYSASQPYTLLTTSNLLRPRRWRWSTIIKTVVLVITVIVVGFFSLFQLQLNLRVYMRDWISHTEATYDDPLAGCFNNLSANSRYHQGYLYNYELSPGVSLLEDYDCYDYASTIRPVEGREQEPTIYHAYWRADLAPVGYKQLATLRSLFATQPKTAIVYLWSNGDLGESSIIKDMKSKVGDRLKTKIGDPRALSVNSPMQDSPHLDFKDDSGYLDGDLLRLLVLYQHGGMWFDMDSLFVRDMSPLMEHEWVSQWDCYMPESFPFNGAFMRFLKHSPYLCEMLSEMANGPLPRKDSIDWGGYLYYRIYRRLLHNGIQPWSVLPWCFTDPMVCTPFNSMPNAFVETEFPTDRLLQSFAYHWHNQWKKEPGSLFRYLDGLHQNTTGWK